MSKFRYTRLKNFVLVCLFGISLVACASAQVSTPSPVSIPTLTTASQSLPDLVIVDVVLDPQSNILCDTPGVSQYDLGVEVANVGEAEAGSFQVGLSNTAIVRIEALGPGEKTSVIISGINRQTTFLKDSGNEMLEQKVVIDAGNEVLEQDENNNTFLIREQIPPCNTSPDLTSTPEPEVVQELEPEQKLIELYPAGQPVIIDSLYMLDATHGWAIAGEADQAQHVLRTSDGGKTWMDVTPPETVTINDPSGRVLHGAAEGFFLNAETAWIIFRTFRWDDTGTLWRTQDGGRSWEPSWRLPSLTFDTISSYPELEFADTLHGWLDIGYFLGAGSGRDELMETVDGGRTWELVIFDGSDQWENWVRGILGGMDFIDPLHGWATSGHPYNDAKTIHWTSDGGHTWRTQELPGLDYDPCGYYAVNSLTLFTSASGMLRAYCADNFTYDPSYDFLYVTNEAGKNWQIYTVPGETLGGSMEVVNSKVIYLLKEKQNPSEGRRADLYRSRDGGHNWTNVSTLGWYGDLEFVDERVGWAVVRNEPDEYGIARFLMLMHTTDGGQTWEQLTPQTVGEGESSRWGTLPPQIKLPTGRAILEPGNAQEMKTLAEIPLDGVTDITFGVEDFELVAGQRNGRVTLWDMNGVEYPMTLHPHRDWVYDVKSIRGANHSLVSASKDGKLFFRQYDTQFAWDVEAGEITSVTLSPGGQSIYEPRTLVTASEKDWAARIWNLDYTNLTELRALKGHTDWVWDVTFSGDGSTLASASSDATVRLWDPASGETLHVLRGHTSTVWRVEFSPDGKTLASASWDGTVKLWDVGTGEEVATLRGHEGPVYGVAFSPDGKLLASGSADGTVIVWDVAQAEILSVLRGHTGPVRSVAFNPEGDILASASDDGTVKFWGVAP
jgi:WD40 repeat protein